MPQAVPQDHARKYARLTASRRPLRCWGPGSPTTARIAETQKQSAAIGITYGLALGYLSCIVQVICLGVTAQNIHCAGPAHLRQRKGVRLAAVTAIGQVAVRNDPGASRLSQASLYGTSLTTSQTAALILGWGQVEGTSLRCCPSACWPLRDSDTSSTDLARGLQRQGAGR